MRNLRELRKAVALTQRELARCTHIPYWRLSHAELGHLRLNPSEIAVIRKVLVDAARKKSARVLEALGGDATQGIAAQAN